MGLRKEIKAVLDQVTLDPRSALRAIDILVHGKISGTKPVKPVFRLSISDVNADKVKVTIDHNAKKIRPDHLKAAALTLLEFEEAFTARKGCKCSGLEECSE